MHYACIFVIIDDDSHPSYSKFRELYKRYIHKFPSVKAFFCRNCEPQSEPCVLLDDDTLVFKDREGLDRIYAKTIKTLKYIKERYTYDYIVRTNLSSFWNIPALLKLFETLPRTEVYGGYGIYTHSDAVFVSGAAFVMSKDVVDYLIEHAVDGYVKFPTIDDVRIGEILTLKYKPTQILKSVYLINGKVIKPANIDKDIHYYRAAYKIDRSVDVKCHEVLFRYFYNDF